MARRTEIDEAIEEEGGVLLLAPRDLYDDAFIGLITQGGWTRALYSKQKLADVLAQKPDAPVALYSRDKLAELLTKDALTDEEEDDAIAHLDFNVTGSMGEGFPWFIDHETVDYHFWQLTETSETDPE